MEWNILTYPILLLGAALGALVNWFVDRYCWTPRFRSPWRVWPKEFFELLDHDESGGKKRKKNDRPTSLSFDRRWADYLPIVGWISWARIGARMEKLPENRRLPGLENRRFWIRPFLVELLSALGIVLLFNWEVLHQMLRPEGIALEPFGTVLLRFGVHVALLVFLLAATLIDLDDMIIPDILTVPGTILGLVLVTVFPQTSLPVTQIRPSNILLESTAEITIEAYESMKFVAMNTVPLNVCSPNPAGNLWRPDDGGMHWIILSALWLFWCFAMLNRVWYARLPFRKAAAIFCRYLRRSPSTKYLVAAALIVPLGLGIWIGVDSGWPGSPHHRGLLSALVGMAVGMAMIWGVRLVGSAVLGREAMGFGDVTLMGMIGAFVGWQSCILIFFLAPFAGLVMGILNVATGRGRELPYGPFLCLATLVLIVAWGRIWTETSTIFELGWIVLVVMLVCLALLGILLGLWRWIKTRIFT